LPSEGKGQKFESSRARHDFNDLSGFAKEPLIGAEASRKHVEERHLDKIVARLSANSLAVVGIEILLGNEER
jgi:hypothetical protein